MNRVVPHLNINSLSLVHLSHVPLRIHGRELKDVITKEIGSEITFIETFEAWFGKRIGHVVLEFRYSKALKLFISEFDSFKQRYFKEPPKVEGILLYEAGRERFFADIHRQTGIDLLQTDGEPPERWFTEKRNLGSRGRYQHSASARRGGYTSRQAQRPANDYDELQAASIKLSRLLLSDERHDTDKKSKSKSEEGGDGRKEEEEENGCYVVVENLPPGCLREELKSVFSMPSPLSVEVRTPRGGDTLGRNGPPATTGAVGYLRYADLQKAELAVMYAEDANLRGRQLKMRIQQPGIGSSNGAKRPGCDVPGDKQLTSQSVEKPAESAATTGKQSSHPPIRCPSDEEEEVGRKKDKKDDDEETDPFFTLHD